MRQHRGRPHAAGRHLPQALVLARAQRLRGCCGIQRLQLIKERLLGGGARWRCTSLLLLQLLVARRRCQLVLPPWRCCVAHTQVGRGGVARRVGQRDRALQQAPRRLCKLHVASAGRHFQHSQTQPLLNLERAGHRGSLHLLHGSAPGSQGVGAVLVDGGAWDWRVGLPACPAQAQLGRGCRSGCAASQHAR